MVLPCTSVIVIIVLLKLAFTCATPEAMFLRSRRRTRVASLPILNPFEARSRLLRCRQMSLLHVLFLLAGNWFGRTFAGPSVGMGALSAHRKSAPVAQAAIAAEIHQPLDIHGDFAPQIALDDVIAVDHLAQLQDFLIGKLRYPARLGDRNFPKDFVSLSAADAIDILERDNDALVGRQVNASDTSQVSYSLRRPDRARPAGRGRQSSVSMSPEKGHKRKKPTAALPLRPGIAARSPTGYLRLIKGFRTLSSTSDGKFLSVTPRRAPLPDSNAL